MANELMESMKECTEMIKALYATVAREYNVDTNVYANCKIYAKPNDDPTKNKFRYHIWKLLLQTVFPLHRDLKMINTFGDMKESITDILDTKISEESLISCLEYKRKKMVTKAIKKRHFKSGITRSFRELFCKVPLHTDINRSFFVAVSISFLVFSYY